MIAHFILPILIFFCCLSLPALAQNSDIFDGMSKRESAEQILSERRDNHSWRYIAKYQKNRTKANIFLVSGGVIALSGMVLVHRLEANVQDNMLSLTLPLLIQGMTTIGTLAALSTGGILHIIARHQLKKGQRLYINAAPGQNGTALSLGFSLHF